ncbi:MAG: transposase [Magnetococcales bacterium]|nr:transposase [Magnetococcales bacterium]
MDERKRKANPFSLRLECGEITRSRRSLFETLDQPALRPLPDQPFPVGQWKKVRVGMDYHIDLDDHYYSVPHSLVGFELDVRLAERTVECFHKGHRVASHCRSHVKGRKTTVAGHMPDAHRFYLESQSPDYVLELANLIGISTRQMAEVILGKQRHPQQGVRACLGILRLGDQLGKDRLEAACTRALAIGATSFRSVQSILRHGLEKLPLSCQEETGTPNIQHDNIRGPFYFH